MAGFTAAAFEGGSGNRESLYVPRAHAVEDRKVLHEFMDEFPFADLVTAEPTIRITHVPVLLDRKRGEFGTIRGHVSRQNPQADAFDGKQTAVVIFRGPHSYISPTWYTNREAVPTWNFAVVHAAGVLHAITDRDVLEDMLNQLIRKFEGGGTAYSLAALPAKYKDRMMSGITGFEMEVQRLEGKFKLGQERSEADRHSILRHLKSVKPERSIYELTQSFYEWAEAADKEGR